MVTTEKIKTLGLRPTKENFRELVELYKDSSLPLELRKEAVMAIGRHTEDMKSLGDFISDALTLSRPPMEIVYQLYLICNKHKAASNRFAKLQARIRNLYKDNETIQKIDSYLDKPAKRKKHMQVKHISEDKVLLGDCEDTLKTLPSQSIQLIFTSPPYYNAREYSQYTSYKSYLVKMQRVFTECYRILEDGRFLVINVSPVIEPRVDRAFESIRYPIHLDLHQRLVDAGFYFIDEIYWVKPEPSVPDRNAGYRQTRTPLAYKPNNITESIMVYRKNCNFLLDENINVYKNREYNRYEDEEVDRTNCWHIAPTFSKKHPAVFPEELVRRVLKYYSFDGDVICDPFAGTGTVGRVAEQMSRTSVLCEVKAEYIKDLLLKRHDQIQIIQPSVFETGSEVTIAEEEEPSREED